MDDFDFGFRPQGKSAPMKPSSSSSSIGSRSASTRSASPFSFDDVFSAPPKAASPPSFDSIFDGFKDPNPKSSSMSSMPVYDKPVYDDDIFDGVPGIKSSTKVEYEDVFGSISKGGGHVDGSGAYDDLLGGLGSSSKRSEDLGSSKRSEDLGGFEELIPGFGGSSPSTGRDPSETNQQKPAGSSAKSTQKMPEDPFVVLETASTPAYPSSGVFTDPLEDLGRPRNSGSANVDASPMHGGIFDDIDALNGLGKSVPPFTYEKSASQKASSPPNSVPNRTQEKTPFDAFDNAIPKTQSTSSFDSRNSTHSSKWNDSQYERYATADQSPSSSEHLETADDVWLTVSEIPLFTQPTNAPPPPRPAPTLINKPASYGRTDHRRKDNESYSQSDTSYMHPKGSVRRSNASPIDELEDFAMNKPQSSDRTEAFSSEDDIETNSAAAASAAAMKEAMDRAEAKFKHAKEVRGRERDAKSAKSREFVQQERDEATPDTQDVEDKENQENLERERLQREREERERERRRIEKGRELERERGRQAVERATREARERAAAEARAKAERAAVDKANAEARQRAERAAVQRAAQEARERAAAEARQKAERAAAEAKEKAVRERAATEARDRAAERAAVERAAAEARVRAERAAVDRAHAEARERAAAAAREKQNKTENDLESFFGMGARANSAPKQRASTTENIFDTQTQSRGSADGTKRSADGTKRTSSTSSSTIKKASSTTNIVDDLTSIFGGAPSSGGEFLEVEGETEERRRARLERHQRTLERAAKALAEKNERDMQTQRDQAERHRIAETLDIEIKRWAAGKEGNLRALLSTLQYVLWPGCGWQPVSLTDLITAAAVKKVYRKATLCIHPDKVQQKGANIQQKYIAEKVFDLLKEAWNKFNSEELF